MKKNNNESLKIISDMLLEGFDLEKIFKILRYSNDKHFIRDLDNELVNGVSFDQAIMNISKDNKFKQYFSFYRLNNNVAIAIKQSLDINDFINSFKSKLKKKLTYPLVLIIFLLFFSIFIVYGLMPTIDTLFIEFNIEKSIFTSVVFFLFRTIPLVIILTFILIFLTSFIIITGVKKNNYKLLDKIISKTYFIKKYLRYYYSIKFAIYYKELLKNGYDATTIISILYNDIDDVALKMIAYEINHEFNEGQHFNDIIKEFPYFDHTFKETFNYMLEMKNKEAILENYINITLSMIQNNINKAIKIFLPCVYVFVGGFVVTIYISIILPMMNVVGSL